MQRLSRVRVPPPLAPAAQQAERRRRGVVQPEGAGSRPCAYLCAAVLASRMPAPCIQERTEPKPAGNSGSSFRFSPPRGRVSCAGNIRARGRWAPPPPGMRSRRGCGRLGSARPDGSGRLRSAAQRRVPASQCALASRALPRRKRVRERRRCPLPSRGAGRGDGGIPPRPESRRADCERGGEGWSGAGTRSARRRPRGALWRLPRAAVVGGGARAPRELPPARRGRGAARPFPLAPPNLPPARGAGAGR